MSEEGLKESMDTPRDEPFSIPPVLHPSQMPVFDGTVSDP